jgi:hypothetical protein
MQETVQGWYIVAVMQLVGLDLDMPLCKFIWTVNGQVYKPDPSCPDIR